MKNKLFLAGLLAVVLVMGMVGCKEEADTPSSSPSGSAPAQGGGSSYSLVFENYSTATISISCNASPSSFMLPSGYEQTVTSSKSSVSWSASASHTVIFTTGTGWVGFYDY